MDAFVVNSTAIKGLNSTSIAEKLTMVNKDGSFLKGPFRLIEFDTPLEGLASPYNRVTPGFINGGKTAGGVTEYVVPNAEISQLKNVAQTVKQ